MAGYQTYVQAPTEYDDLVYLLLRAAQRRGRQLELRVRYRRGGTNDGWTRWSLGVDGRGWRIACWAQQIERDLPIVAEGWGGKGHGTTACRIASSFIARWFDYCIGTGQDEPGERVVVNGRDVNRWRWAVLELPEDSATYPRLWVADEVVALWAVGGIPDELVVEEMHTAAEFILRRLLEAGQGVTFPRLLERAELEGFIPAESRSALDHLNRVWRVPLKHRAEVVDETGHARLHNDLLAAVDALDLILSQFGESL